MIIFFGCCITAFILGICLTAITIVGLTDNVYADFIEDNKYGLLLISLYVLCYLVHLVVLSIKFMDHLLRKKLAYITICGFVHIPFIIYSSYESSGFLDYSIPTQVVLFTSTIIIYLVLLAHTILSIIFFFYTIICYCIFANKTYKAPPLTPDTSPIHFQQLPSQYTQDGIMLFSIAPGSTNHFRRRILETDIEQLKEQEITVVVSCLTPHDYIRLGIENYEEMLYQNNIQLIKCPMPDFWVPKSRYWYDEMATEVSNLLVKGEKVLVHCNSGKGRTGLFAAAVLSKILTNQKSKDYIKIIKLYLPGAFDTFLQRLYFHMYINNIK
ncbi:Tyrosine specific protein phosphatases domain-containing protein [Entamoeba marina]